MVVYLRSIAEWIRAAFNANAALTLAVTSLALVGAIAPAIVSWLVSLLIDSVSRHQNPTGLLVILVSILILWAVASKSLPSASENLREDLAVQVRGQLMDFAGAVPTIEHFETPQLVDRVTLLNRDAYRLGGVQHLLTAVSAMASAVFIGFLLGGIDPLLVLLLLVAFVPSLASTIADFRMGQIWLGNENHRRVGDTATALLIDPRHALLVRAYGLPASFRALAARAQDRQTTLSARVRWRFGIIEAAGFVLYLLALAVAILLVAGRLATGAATPGQLTLLLLLTPQIAGAARSVAASGTLIVDGVQTFGQFLALKDYARDHTATATASPPARIREGIEIRDLQFRYPGATTAAVDGLDLSLPAGAVICLVGANGAGKSSLVKLLAGFYTPTAGQIRVDDIPLSDLDPELWFGRLSTGFQDFARFEFTLFDSVAAGDQRITEESVREALDSALALPLVDQLPSGVHTQLGTRFSQGVGLSGGQWQRVALARAFARHEPLLLLLDEPASALDPESEVAMYTAFLERARRMGSATGSITVIVSHRLSTARLADVIVVMSHGRIAETGTHENLMKADGDYARLYRLQTAPYQA